MRPESIFKRERAKLATRQAKRAKAAPARKQQPARTRPLNPGSHEAISHGCTCDRIRNGYGRGVGCNGFEAAHFFVAPTCPLHGDAGEGQVAA